MEDKIQRSYAKESTKSKPSGIRFDLEKVEFVKTREKLNTYQKVVDFLLNKYWWEWKVPNPTYKEAPPLDLKATFPIPEPKQVTVRQKTKFDFLKAKVECQSEEEYSELLLELNESTLSEREKREVITA